MSHIDREKQTIKAMLHIYCRAHHDAPTLTDELCDDCRQLLDYACQRLDVCPFHEQKPACNHCTVHCYSRSMRSRIQQTMRFSGPRMLWRHPLLALLHMIDRMRKAPKLKGLK